jgi:polysaccharide biosynthesis transport protein
VRKWSLHWPESGALAPVCLRLEGRWLVSDELRQLGAIRRTATASEPITGGPVGAGPRVPAARGSASRPLPALSKGPDPLGLLKAFRRRWKLAVGLGVVLAVVAGGLARVVLPRPKFEAKAVLLVAAQPPQVLFTTMDTKQQVDCGRYQKTQVAWIKSRVVLNAALQRPGIKQYKMVRERGDPARWLQGDLDVNCVENSELLEISLQGESPDEVAGLVNAVKDAYLEEVVNIEHKRRQDRYGMLRKLKDQYVETLKSKRQGLKKLAEAVGSNDRETVALKQQFAIQHLATVEQELLEVQSQKRKAGAELALAEQMDQAVSVPTVTMTAVNKAINDDSIVSQLQARLSESQARYAQTLDSMRRISRRADGDPALT